MIDAAPILLIALFAGASPDPGTLKVLILPTINGERVPREPSLSPESLRAFSTTFADAAAGVFAWRRWAIVIGEEAQNAIAASRQGECRSEACAKAVGRSAGATHVLFSRLTRLKDASCTAVLTLEPVVKDDPPDVDRSGTRTRPVSIREDIRPCGADNLLLAASDLGHRIAEGPRASVRPTISLTPLELPSLDIPDIADVGDYNASTSTSVRARRGGLSLDRALEIYKAKHMFVFDDPDRQGLFYIARDRKVINDCDVRRAASAPLTRDMLEFCDGNSWEYAWIGFPIGVLIAGLGANDLGDGGFFTFVFGAAIAAGSAVIALLFNVDAADPQDGTHFSDRGELERIVQKSNRQLREVLDLTEAEVTIAGMRK